MGQPGGCGDVDIATAQAATVVGDAVDSRRGASFQNGSDTNGFAALRIKHVVRETSVAVSLVLSARMINNDALTEDEVAEGWVLTCQSLPTSQSVTVV